MIFGTVSNNWYVYILGLFGYFQSQYRCLTLAPFTKNAVTLCINGCDSMGLGAFASFAMGLCKRFYGAYGGNYDG
jgi:hypothetical protein